MEERKFIKLKKEEYGIKEYIKRVLGKGKISMLDIEYTPIGEKIIVSTSRPGLIIGRRGEKIEELTNILKTRFKLENPHIEIKEIVHPLFDSQLVADEIALALERMGNLKFKVIAYRKLQEIMNGGALGCEFRISGKLPSERAKSWRFSQGYLKKSGEPSKEIYRAQSVALTKTGIIGIKVAIMAPDAKRYDKIDIDQQILDKIKAGIEDKQVPSKTNKNTKKVTDKDIEKIAKKVESQAKVAKSSKIMEKGEVVIIDEDKAKKAEKVSKDKDGGKE